MSKIKNKINHRGGNNMKLRAGANGSVVDEFDVNFAKERPQDATEVFGTDGLTAGCYVVHGEKGHDDMFYGKIEVYSRAERFRYDNGTHLDADPRYVHTGTIIADGGGITLSVEQTATHVHLDEHTRPDLRIVYDSWKDNGSEVLGMIRTIAENVRDSNAEIEKHVSGWESREFTNRVDRNSGVGGIARRR
jgi:hypothetical protein